MINASSNLDNDTGQIWSLLDQITDPEIPVISIRELGILQDIRVEKNTVVVVVTPTYSGCPAMREIRQDIAKLLADEGYLKVLVETQLAPAWTTDWITPEGAKKLHDYGIAPPQPRGEGKISCPLCGSNNTQLISEFGSTACKALYKCTRCLEPFDYFKCI
ncbi:MAG: ring-1,2-phenylacetyl-CoA epoxidase subunit PaaD [Cryomorphaceae bacterium]|jgi:ring-1,2-phenylacetyl-CoA epoxidase subunit PaaD